MCGTTTSRANNIFDLNKNMKKFSQGIVSYEGFFFHGLFVPWSPYQAIVYRPQGLVLPGGVCVGGGGDFHNPGLKQDL